MPYTHTPLYTHKIPSKQAIVLWNYDMLSLNYIWNQYFQFILLISSSFGDEVWQLWLPTDIKNSIFKLLDGLRFPTSLILNE